MRLYETGPDIDYLPDDNHQFSTARALEHEDCSSESPVYTICDSLPSYADATCDDS
jgi:hypothetical protein